MTTVVIVDSGSANLKSIFKASELTSLKPRVTDSPKIIANANAIIFPGVGSFEHAALMIKRKSLFQALLSVIAEGKPFLGICLGMQLLFPHSEEALTGNNLEGAEGLGVIPGEVKRFPAGLPVPHVGWNSVASIPNYPLFEGLNDGSYFYFTHSYYVQTESEEHILAKTDYGFNFTSAVMDKNIIGVQFHPEKSGPAGLRLLANFGKIIADRG